MRKATATLAYRSFLDKTAGRAAREALEDDGSPVARGALLGGVGLGGTAGVAGGALGAGIGSLAGMRTMGPLPPKLRGISEKALKEYFRKRRNAGMLAGALLLGVPSLLAGGAVGAGLGAGVGALRQAVSRKEQ